MDGFSRFKEEITELMQRDPAAAAAEIKEYLKIQCNTPLHIAITGESGAGKSSFINALRGLRNTDEGAAPTGCVETTSENKSYSHPKYPNVTFWDLPGIGTVNFKATEYLDRVEFRKFDFFIIISDSRFRENDVKLAMETQRMEKKFYFVRSKIDNDLQSEEKSKKNFNEVETLEKIKKSFIQGLQQQGFQDPKVFLLSSFHPEKYDFPQLLETIDKELPHHKKHAVLLAVETIHKEVMDRKKVDYIAGIKYYGGASAVGAAVPIPGVSVALDLAMIVTAFNKYVNGFGLDDASLQNLAESTGVPKDDLRCNINSVPLSDEINTDLALKLLTHPGSLSLLLATEEWSRGIPLVGVPVAAVASFMATYRALAYFLDEIATEAHRIYKSALRLGTADI